MFKKFFHRYCFGMTEIKSFIDFHKAPNNSKFFHIFNSRSFTNVIPDARDNRFIFENCRCILSRDTESMTACFTSFRDEAQDLSEVFLLFAKPELEHIYFSDFKIFSQAFFKQFKSSEKKPTEDELSNAIGKYFDKPSLKPETEMKGIFRNWGLAYNKPKFAQDYFSQFNFKESSCPYIDRMVRLLKDYESN